jgi:O-antigen/teichoic acid export membrane protein
VGWIVGIWQTRDYWGNEFDSLKETWIKNWIFGRWIMGGTTANWMAMEFYPVMTAGLINFAAAGAYRALQNLVAPIHVLIRATDTFLTPRASKIFQNKGLSALNRTIGTTYSIIGIPIAAILFIAIVFPNELLFLFYGDTYLAFSSGVYIMAAYYVLLYFYSPALTALKATRISRPIFIAFIAAIIAMATVGILMILEWGLYGTLAGQLINALVVVIVLWGSWIHAKRKL